MKSSSTTTVDNSGDTACRTPAIADVLNPDTDTSRPGRSPTSAPGLADQKDTDRLMDIMQPRPHAGQL